MLPCKRSTASRKRNRNGVGASIKLLLSATAGAIFVFCPVSEAMSDPNIYGTYDSQDATIIPSNVYKSCFGGFDLGSCVADTTGWQYQYLDAYNAISNSLYCLSCCSNTGTDGDTWSLTCGLPSTLYVQYTNRFGYEFRFGRNQYRGDQTVITCPIWRSACNYYANGTLVEPCVSDGSYLTGYTLKLEVLEKVKGLYAWKSVQSCSVETTESDELPTSFSEVIEMTEVYPDNYTLPAGFIFLITVVSLAVFSCCVRYWRDDQCIICGYPLIYTRDICAPCRFYGYDPPSDDLRAIIKHKRIEQEGGQTGLAVLTYGDTVTGVLLTGGRGVVHRWRQWRRDVKRKKARREKKVHIVYHHDHHAAGRKRGSGKAKAAKVASDGTEDGTGYSSSGGGTGGSVGGSGGDTGGGSNVQEKRRLTGLLPQLKLMISKPQPPAGMVVDVRQQPPPVPALSMSMSRGASTRLMQVSGGSTDKSRAPTSGSTTSSSNQPLTPAATLTRMGSSRRNLNIAFVDENATTASSGNSSSSTTTTNNNNSNKGQLKRPPAVRFSE